MPVLLKEWCDQFSSERMFRFTSYTFLSELVVITNPEDAKKVLLRPDILHRIKLTKRHPLTGEGLLNATGANHAFQRKLLAKAFSKLHVKHFIPIYNEHADNLCKVWMDGLNSEENGKNIDVQKYFQNLAFDIIGKIGFGYDFNTQKSKANKFVETLREHVTGMRDQKIRMLLNFFPFLTKLPFGPGKRLMEANKQAKSDINDIFMQRKKKIESGELTEEEKRDILSVMINVRDDETGKGMSDQLIQDSSYTFLLAAHDTTATALTWLTFRIAKDPVHQARVRAEIEEFSKRNEELTLEMIDDLPFTNSFIKEVLRWHPSIPMTARLLQKEFQLNGTTFPKGTKFLLPFFYYNMKNSEEILTFDPENRMLEEDLTKQPTPLYTFGYGPYNCIGQHFASLEMKVAFIKLLQKFEFSIDPGNEKYTIKSMTGSVDQPVFIRVKALK